VLNSWDGFVLAKNVGFLPFRGPIVNNNHFFVIVFLSYDFVLLQTSLKFPQVFKIECKPILKEHYVPKIVILITTRPQTFFLNSLTYSGSNFSYNAIKAK